MKIINEIHFDPLIPKDLRVIIITFSSRISCPDIVKMLSRVDFPELLGPRIAKYFPHFDFKIHIPQCYNFCFSSPVDLTDTIRNNYPVQSYIYLGNLLVLCSYFDSLEFKVLQALYLSLVDLLQRQFSFPIDIHKLLLD